ncbi:MAG TPA: STAS domain-containing protein [Acidobacteriota bacterium]|nr:STAS domain-containing protein [Acidobacteriota bacterium]
MKHHERQIDGVVIVALEGKLTLGSGDVKLRQLVNDLLERGETKILLDLGGVRYMNGSGTGELVAAYTSCANRGAQLKPLNLSSKVRDLLLFTQLISIFEDYNDVAEAVHSFSE